MAFGGKPPGNFFTLQIIFIRIKNSSKVSNLANYAQALNPPSKLHVLGTIPYFQNQVFQWGVEHLCLDAKGNHNSTKVSQLNMYDLFKVCLNVKPLKNGQKSTVNPIIQSNFIVKNDPKQWESVRVKKDQKRVKNRHCKIIEIQLYTKKKSNHHGKFWNYNCNWCNSGVNGSRDVHVFPIPNKLHHSNSW